MTHIVKDYRRSYEDMLVLVQEDNPSKTRRFAALIPGSPTNRVLDVGCAEGNLVRMLKAAGHDAYGLDIVPRYDGCIAWDIEAEAPSIGQFDYIFLNDTLEHFRAPASALSNIRELLKDDGQLFIHTPNALYWKRCAWGLHLRWNIPPFVLGSCLHLQLYDWLSLQQLCSLIGLKVDEFYGGLFPLVALNLHARCRKAEPLDVEVLVEKWKRMGTKVG